MSKLPQKHGFNQSIKLKKDLIQYSFLYYKGSNNKVRILVISPRIQLFFDWCIINCFLEEK